LAFGLVEIFIQKLICCTAPTREADPNQVRIRIKDISDLHTDPSKSSTRFLCGAGFLRAIKEFLAICKLRQQATQTRWLSNQRMQTLRPLLPLHVHVRLNIQLLELLHAYETTWEASCFTHMQDVREYTYLSYL
jgi:hypothetical protein